MFILVRCCRALTFNLKEYLLRVYYGSAMTPCFCFRFDCVVFLESGALFKTPRGNAGNKIVEPPEAQTTDYLLFYVARQNHIR